MRFGDERRRSAMQAEVYSKVEICCMRKSALDVEGESVVGCLYEDEIEEQELGEGHGVEKLSLGILIPEYMNSEVN